MTKPSHRATSIILIAPALGLAGCGGDSGLAWIWSLGGSITFSAFKWAFLCGFIGLVIAGPVFWILKRSGALHIEWKIAKLLQLLTLISLLVVFPIACAYGGFFEGVLRATEYELLEGTVAKEIYPPLGGVGADFVGALLLGMEQPRAESASPESASPESASPESASPEDLEVLVSAFRGGQRQIAAAAIPEILTRIEGQYLQGVAGEIKEKAQAKVPILQQGTGAQILDWFVDNCGKALVRGAADDGLGVEGFGPVVRLFRDFVDRLPEAAELEEDPELVSHSELSRFIVEATLARGTLKIVVKPFCRSQQIGAALILILAILIPVCLLRLPGFFSWLLRRRRPDAN